MREYTGENNINSRGAKKMHEHVRQLKMQTALAIIRGASHNFVEEGKQEEFYKETVGWFKGFL